MHVCISVCDYVCMTVDAYRDQKRVLNFPGVGGTGSCDLPNVGSGNLALSNSNKCS